MKTLLSNRFTILFISLVAFILIVPPLVEYSKSMAIVPWVLSVIIVAIVLATRNGRDGIMHKAIITLAIAELVVLWIYHFFHGHWYLERIDAAIFIFLLFTACGIVLHQLSRQQRVDHETIATALSAYVLFGMAMSRVFFLLYLFDPNAFTINLPNPEYSILPSFLYFSFVVLSTVGFGDITPASAAARSLMIIEAIFGVFYMTVVISRLVSLYSREKSDDPDL